MLKLPGGEPLIFRPILRPFQDMRLEHRQDPHHLWSCGIRRLDLGRFCMKSTRLGTELTGIAL